MRVGRCVVAVCIFASYSIGSLVAQASNPTSATDLVQELSNNTSACSSSSNPAGNQPYCFASFNGFAANPTDVGAETSMPDSPAGHVSSVPIKELLYPGWNGQVICEYQPWFGSSNHKSVGYSENSAATVQAQDSFMLAVGCDINLIDYYGALDPSQSFNLATANAVFSDLSSRAGYPLKFGIMEDKNALTSTCSPSSTNESVTLTCVGNALIAEMDYIDSHYVNSGAYFTDGGDPVVFSFVTPETWPVLSSADWGSIWSSVKAHTDTYTAPFKYIFEFGAFTTAAYDNGRFAWMQPPAFSSTQQFWWGSVNSLSPTYLDTLYSAGLAHLSQITVGGLWKGFDDNNASWSANRVIAEQCGQVLLDTANEIAKYFGGSNPQLPYVQVATWNDYEEGTAVEPGIDNCYTISASLSGNQLSWALTASDSYASLATVHHFTVYYADAGANLYVAASNIPTTTTTLNLSSLIPSGTWTLYVEMVGQPLIINRISNGVSFNNGASSARLSPASLGFNNQTVGTSSSAASITLTNSGSTPLSIYSIATSGTFAQTNNCPASLAASSSCNVSIIFSPAAAGTQTGSLSVSDSAGSVPQVTPLSGTGVVPTISFAPAQLTFSPQPLGSTSGTQTITLTNSGPGLLMINGLSASGSYTVSGDSCSGTIAVSASCSFSVAFTPSAAGAQSGSVTVNSNATGTNAVLLSGAGADFAVSASPSQQSVTAGSPATYTISVPSEGATFSGAIILTCSALPADATCNLTPSSLNADTSSTLTITTQATQTAFLGTEAPGNLLGLTLPFSGVGLFGFVLIKRRRKSSKTSAILTTILVMAVLAAVGFEVACGGVSHSASSTIPGTAAGTYNVVVTASSGSLKHSANLTLIVK